jgi:hypothetical protein
VLIVSNWKIYVKAGRPGWVSLIPVYGTWILFELLGYNPWLSLLVLIPIINIIPAFMIVFGLARVFGKSKLFAFFGLFIFNFVGYPMLAFGKAQYKKPNINK